MSRWSPVIAVREAPCAVWIGAALQLLACGCMGTASAPHARIPFTPNAEDPWEPELSASSLALSDETAAPAYRPLGDVFSSLVDYYRAKIGPDSIRRCPFHETCSALAQRALREHGALGLLWIIDRYFYREHTAASGYYERVSEQSGILKLDDALLMRPR